MMVSFYNIPSSTTEAALGENVMNRVPSVTDLVEVVETQQKPQLNVALLVGTAVLVVFLTIRAVSALNS